MTRLAVAGLLAVIIALTLLATLRVDTNPSGVFGAGEAPITALETEAGRQGVILIRSADPEIRVEIAQAALRLVSHPMIERVSAGPAPGDPAVLDWLWEHRFRLAPPSLADLEAEAMGDNLKEAVEQLMSSEGMVLGDRLLRDPTGSFRRVLNRLQSVQPDLGSEAGFWRGRDGGVLIFLTFLDAPLDARALGVLTTSLRALVDSKDARIHLAGPRFISTEVSAATERVASLAGGIAGVLLMLWLLFAIRNWRGLVSAFLPLALGLGTAALFLQLVYGSVHVIALGFGGALAGLALDYPLHLAGHGKSGARRARGLIMIGVVTTITAFLAMTGAGLDVLTQTGLFVAIGLGVAALTSILVGTSASETRTLPMEKLFWSLPGGYATLAVLLSFGAAVTLQTSTDINRPLFDLPEQVEQDLKEVQRAVAMPATQYLLRVEGDTAEQVLQRELRLKPLLEQAVAAGEIAGYRMANSVLPALTQQAVDLPAAALIMMKFDQALALAGLQQEYADTLRAAYDDALRVEPVGPEDWRNNPVLAPLLLGISTGDERAEDTVLLIPPLDAAALAKRLQLQPIEGVTFLDLAEAIWDSVETLRATAATWLGIGAAFAAIALSLMLRQPMAVLRIVLTVGASLALTAAALSLILGSLTVFQIVALTVVVGIGVDYALFLDPKADRHAQVLAARSVGLCAVSTLLAFFTMAWSDVRVMGEIGLTVSLGVLVVIVLSTGMMGRAIAARSTENER